MTAGRIAPRLGMLSIVIAIIALIAVLPERYQLLPDWVGYLVAAVMIAPSLFVSFTHGSAVWRRIERLVDVSVVTTAFFLNTLNLLIAAYNLVENPSKLQPVPLFYTSIGIWSGNILIFTLIYWLVDCGGADARQSGSVKYPDFDFPAMDDSEHVRPGWKPGMIDYLFLAFTTSTAFSPTEAMPLTARAKILVILQSSVSLVTIAIVAARTINILK